MENQPGRDRLEKVLLFINKHAADESYFGFLYRKLLEEIDIETTFQSNKSSCRYITNLEQTKNKYARIYVEEKSRKSRTDALNKYNDFANQFADNVREALAGYIV